MQFQKSTTKNGYNYIFTRGNNANLLISTCNTFFRRFTANRNSFYSWFTQVEYISTANFDRYQRYFHCYVQLLYRHKIDKKEPLNKTSHHVARNSVAIDSIWHLVVGVYWMTHLCFGMQARLKSFTSPTNSICISSR